MSLHDTDALIVEVATAVESLPDAAAVVGRTHQVVNTGTADAVLSVAAGLGFQSAAGFNSATVTIKPGQSLLMQAVAGRWKMAPALGGRRIFASTGVSDGSGLVTFNFSPPFDTVPVVQGHPGPTGTTDLTEVILTAVSAASCTFRVRRAPSVTILGISVITFPINAVGFTVQCHATEPGQGV